MDSFNWNFSHKNVPYPNNKDYENSLISQTSKFLRNVTWKATVFKKPKSMGQNKNTFGFKSSKTPETVKELEVFTNRLLSNIKNIKYNNRKTNKLQKTLKSEISKINQTKEIIVNADKTSNMYKVKYEQYNKLTEAAIEKDYKKVNIIK